MKTVVLGAIIATMSVLVTASDKVDDIGAVEIYDGVPGSLSGTKTLIQAQTICAATSAVGSETSSDYESCLEKYAPFLELADEGGISCASTTLSWGGSGDDGSCSGTLPGMPEGGLATASNESNTSVLQGYAQFICEGGSFSYVSGSCAALPKKCAAGELITWAITSPSWASSEGDPRSANFDPQPDCAAYMPEAYSGQVANVFATISDPNNSKSAALTPFSSYYDTSSSAASARCFDGEWYIESSVCDYVPSNCAAQSYTTADGCTFAIPAFAHGSEILVGSPSPSLSKGSVKAKCWDSKIEIRSESCALSCKQALSSNSWGSESSDGGSCSHGAVNNSNRVESGSTFTIPNQNSTHIGLATYTCNDGFFSLDDTTCRPIGCQGKPAGSWTVGGNTCNHNPITDTVPHGTSIIAVSDNLPTLIGKKEYSCNFGNWVAGSVATCATLSGVCYGDEAPPAGQETFTVPSWGGCNAECHINAATGEFTCYDNCSSSCSCNEPCGTNNEYRCESGVRKICTGGSWVNAFWLNDLCI
jgi:hypothetical protein